jgi:MoxR-like ATPase
MAKTDLNGKSCAQVGFQSLLTEMRGVFFEREIELHRLFITAIAQGNYLLLGAPGTAKTFMIEVFAKQCQLPYFSAQLFRTTSPEEVWGPLDMIKFKQGTQARVLTGTMAQCRISFIDEIFKGNSAVNNSMLRAAEVSSRKFKNGTEGWIDLPLRMLVAASNELPEGGTQGELSALYDRFEVKRQVRYIEDPKNFEKMLRLSATPQIKTILDEQTFLDAGTEAAKVTMVDPVMKAIVGVWQGLRGSGYTVSDRKFRNSVRYVKACAWLDGRDEATDDDIEILGDMLWDTPDQYAPIRKIVLQFTNPITTQANQLYDDIVEKYASVKGLTGQSQSQKAAELNAQIKLAVKTLRNLATASKAEGKSAKVAEDRAEACHKINEELVNTILL